MGLLSLRFYVISLIFLCSNLGCSSLFYYPTKAVMFYDPKQVGLVPEDIYFKDEQDRKLHGWYFASKEKSSKGTIIYFHGNAQNLTSHFMSMSWIPEKGYNFFIFDYPGYGLSEGDPSPQATVESGRAAIRYIAKNKDQRPLIIFAHSLGGNIGLRSVLDLKNEQKFAGVVAYGTFSSYQKIGRVKLSKNWVTWILQPVTYLVLSDEFAPGKLNEISPIPLLVIHGQKDNVVEPELGEFVFQQAAEPKQMWKIPDGLHNDVFWIDDFKYREPFLQWLNGVTTANKNGSI